MKYISVERVNEIVDCTTERCPKILKKSITNWANFIKDAVSTHASDDEGHWIKISKGDKYINNSGVEEVAKKTFYKCSNCGRVSVTTKYCPSCGKRNIK